jgi:hypothetical protein
LSKLEITADGDLVLKANLSSQTDISLTSHSGDITQSGDIKAVQNIVLLAYKPSLPMTKLEVRSLLILKPVIAPSLIRDCPLGAGVNTADGNIITDLSKLEITADGDLVLKANLSSQTDQACQ